MVNIHPTCIISTETRLGKGTILHPYIVIAGETVLGEQNDIHPFCMLGSDPQDPKHDGSSGTLEIGSRNSIRDHVSISAGTRAGGGATRIGDDNLIMSHSHIGHDAKVASSCTISSGTFVAGHVEIESFSRIGGNSSLSQRVRIGSFSFVGGQSGIDRDVPPYCVALGNRPRKIRGVNLIGLRRHGFSRGQINDIRGVVRLWTAAPSKSAAISELERHAMSDNLFVEPFLRFVRDSRVGVLR